jgi:hypothetical protein
MARTPGPRWDFDALFTASGLVNYTALAAHLGVDRSYVSHIRRRGLTTEMAWSWSRRLRVEPGSVWPTWPGFLEPDGAA